ncbi:MAG TPA: substrate-binding domain-containing protein, partial [Usitatibacter sp.]|nr:substrate-binding domain-containing protein [Usitatibacter sp.]
MRGMWIVTLLFAFGAGAAELTVMSTGAVKAPFTEASAQWSKDTGHKVNATFDPAGPLRQKIASGMRG